VADLAEHAPIGGADPGRRRLQGGSIGDLERDVVVAAARRVRDQHQLVVAVVAGEAAGPGDAVGLDQAEDGALEVDRGVALHDRRQRRPD
jgi:hypothetical protein